MARKETQMTRRRRKKARVDDEIISCLCTFSIKMTSLMLLLMLMVMMMMMTMVMLITSFSTSRLWYQDPDLATGRDFCKSVA